MPISDSHTLSRLLKLFETDRAPGRKSNTIKKPASATCNKNGCEARRDSSNRGVGSNDSPPQCGIQTPRLVPERFVVRLVRKSSDNGSPPALANIQKTIGKGSVCSYEPPIRTLEPLYDGQSNVTESPPIQSDSKSDKPLTNGVNGLGEDCSRPTFNLLLGLRDPSSPYFTRCLFSLPYLSDEKGVLKAPDDTIHHVLELDPQAFELYKTWARTGTIGFKSLKNIKSEHVWIACWPLMNAFILGCSIEETRFADQVMDVLLERLASDVKPDLETVVQLFDKDKKGTPRTLRKLVIDRFIDAQQQSSNTLETCGYPLAFRLCVLQTALSRLCRNYSMPAPSVCEYHMHTTTETCYKAEYAAADTSKERRLAGARKASAKDAAFVTANMLHNGVKGIDWEQRRAEANEALRAEIGGPWVRCRRPEGVEPDYQCSPIKKYLDEGASVEALDREYGHVSTRPGRQSSTSGIAPKCDLMGNLDNSPTVRHGTSLKNTKVCAAPVLQTNKTTPPQPSVMSVEPASHHPPALIQVELYGSSVVDKIPSSNLALRYKPSVNRLLRAEAANMEAMGNLRGIGPSHHMWHDPQGSKAYLVESSLDLERSFKCPGAYPESELGTLGVGQV